MAAPVVQARTLIPPPQTPPLVQALLNLKIQEAGQYPQLHTLTCFQHQQQAREPTLHRIWTCCIIKQVQTLPLQAPPLPWVLPSLRLVGQDSLLLIQNFPKEHLVMEVLEVAQLTITVL